MYRAVDQSPLSASIVQGDKYVRQHVGDDRDGAVAAHQVEGMAGRIMPGQKNEAVLKSPTHFFDAPDFSRGILEPDDRGDLGKPGECLQRKVDAGSGWHIVDDDGQLHALRDRLEVAHDAFLAWPVIVWGHDKRGIGAARLGRGSMGDGQFGAVRACAGNHGHPAARSLYAGSDDFQALIPRQCRVLPLWSRTGRGR